MDTPSNPLVARVKAPAATPLRPRKRGLIIGASSGIGAALARRLAQEGFTLALVSRRAGLLSALCEEINRTAGEPRGRAFVHDVRDFSAVPALLTRIVAEIGGLDLAVYAAGVNHPPGMQKLEFEADREMLEVNLVGAFAWLDPVAALFQSAKAGQIVGIASVAADRGRVGNPAYNSSKAGLVAYLEALRNRLSRHGVHVLTVKPGFVQTEQLKAAPRVIFPISAERAADHIWDAIRRRKQQIYAPSWWGLVMFVVRNIPSIVFRRLSF
jgi:short-subunit dehydrogenase